jgi:hypothetical protein
VVKKKREEWVRRALASPPTNFEKKGGKEGKRVTAPQSLSHARWKIPEIDADTFENGDK